MTGPNGMPDFDKLNYYEMLRLTAEASLFEIKQAYADALAIYGHDSLATYSFFTEDERQAILKLLETAFRTLTDPTRRKAYDQSLVAAGCLDPSRLAANRTKKAIPLFETAGITAKTDLKRKISEKISAASISQLTRDICAAEEISGQDLKRLREKIGVSLEEIYDATRISISTIKTIETNDFENLPSTLYLKSFLRAYASLIKLDPQIVVTGYLKHAGIE